MDKASKKIESREKLIEFSRAAKLLRELEGLDLSVNETLLTMIYNTNDATEFNTFKRWKEQGYTILKGSKAFLIWGQPIRRGKEDKDKEKSKEGEAKNEYEFFPVCYLFSNKQVFKQEDKEIVPMPQRQKEPEYLDI